MKAHATTFTLRKGDIIKGREADFLLVQHLRDGERCQTYLAQISKLNRSASKMKPKLTLKKGMRVILKTVKPNRSLNARDMGLIIAKVNGRLEAERMALSRLVNLSCVAKVIDIGSYPLTLQNDEASEAKVLVQEFIEGDPLSKYFYRPPENLFIGITNEEGWFDLAIDLAESLLAVHQQGVIHRDIWPDNIMIRHGKPVYIDFGEAVFRDAMIHEEVGKSRQDNAYVAPEWRGKTSWPTRRSDLYSLGGVLYFLACGEAPPIELPAEDSALKDLISKIISRKNPSLLAQNCGIPDVIVPCLRIDRSSRVSDADMLLQKLHTFQIKKRKTNLLKSIRIIQQEAARLQKHRQGFFTELAEIELRQVSHRIRDMASGIRELTGTREEIEWGLTNYLGVLRKGDEYLTITTPQFWHKNNMGLDGPYLSMNGLLARRGVRIRRCFLITVEEALSTNVREIARAHIDLQNTLPAHQRQNLETRYRVIETDDLRKQLIEGGEHFGVWITKEEALRIFLIYDLEWRLRTVRMLRTDADPEALRDQFEARWFKDARPLEDLFSGKIEPGKTQIKASPAEFVRQHVFISYCHKNQKMLDSILEMLSPFVDRKFVRLWSDKMINPGEPWKKMINDAIKAARVGVFIASAQSLDSSFIKGRELPVLLAAAKRHEIECAWIAASDSNYQVTRLNSIQCLNDPNRPLDSLKKPEQIKTLRNISRKIVGLYNSKKL